MRNRITLLSIFLVLVSSSLGFTEESPKNGLRDSSLTFGGSLRLRYEDKNNIKFGATVKGNDEDYFLSQFRLNIKWKPSEKFSFFIEGQDARISGEVGINENSTPNIFADAFDLHQGYFDFHTALAKQPVRVRVGRQKFNLGALRLVASLEWVNTARVWDGVRISIGTKKGKKVDLISSRLVAVDPNHFNDWAKTGSRLFNSDFHVLYYTDATLFPKTTVDGYWMLRHEKIKDDAVHTVGSRFKTLRGDSDPNDDTHRTFDNNTRLITPTMVISIFFPCKTSITPMPYFRQSA